MNIAYLTGIYPRATDTFIQREVQELRAQGIQVNTFAVRRPGAEHQVGAEQTAEQQQTIYLLPLTIGLLITAHTTLFLTSPQRYWRTLRLAWATSQPGVRGWFYQMAYFLEAAVLAQQICHRHITHLHNHIASSSCTVAMLAAELGGFTFSFTIHGPHIFFEPYRWRLDEKIKRAAFVVCISHFCRSQAMIFAPPEHWHKMHIVHCGVDLNLFDTIPLREPQKHLLYVGRLAAEKGLPILLECLKQLVHQHPEMVLTVVGDGKDRQPLTELVDTLGLQPFVKFVGYQSQAAVRNYLKHTDVFVLPSFAEGVPVVLMEAMATGVPIVATRIAGIPELVDDHKSGFLVPPGDPHALQEALTKLLDTPDLRQQFSQWGTETVHDHFNLTSEVAKLIALIKHYSTEIKSL